MTTAQPTEPAIEDVLKRISRRERTRHTLARGGVLSIDRGLPFLIVHRSPPDRDDEGTARLVSAEAAFLVAGAEEDAEAARLVRAIAEEGANSYGAFLVLELWTSPDPASGRFVVHAPAGPAPETVSRLTEALGALGDLRPGLSVAVELGDERAPPGLAPLLSVEESWQNEVLVIGLEVPPIWRDGGDGRVDPLFLRIVQRALSGALRRAVYEFVRVQTRTKVQNHLALGTRTLPERVWEIDRALHELERAFDLLLLVSPINSEAARDAFRRSRCQRAPDFHYRLLPLDPDLLKRRLYDVRIEEIDDPAFADLFEDKRQELDTQLTMLRERGSANFRYSSQRMFGTVDAELLRQAEALLEQTSVPRARSDRNSTVDAEGFRAAAAAELEHYRARHPALDREIQIRRDLVGLMVSSGNLLIGETLRLDADRVEPLLHHEVGTHVLTYVNGSAQPLKQLAQGLAGYDELQEGLAVLSEYLVDGLGVLRMRLLAARVLAAHSVEQGADFVETYRLLSDRVGYSGSGAWHIALRVHASGGFTRDFIYLRGLIRLLEFLREGGELEPLYLGKMAQKHVPVIAELRHRGVLKEPPLRPRFLDDPDAAERLRRVRRGIELTQMISGRVE
jgi:uncharacterized protein (TIGR02421 family)